MDRRVLAWKPPSREDSPGIPQPGPRGREGLPALPEHKTVPLPLQTQLPLVESEPQFLTKRRPKSRRRWWWGGLLPPLFCNVTDSPSSIEPNLFQALRDPQVLEPCSFSWHSGTCLSSALTGLRCRSLSARPWTGRQKAWLPAKGLLHTLQPMLPAPCFSLPQFSHLQGGKGSLSLITSPKYWIKGAQGGKPPLNS